MAFKIVVVILLLMIFASSCANYADVYIGHEESSYDLHEFEFFNFHEFEMIELYDLYVYDFAFLEHYSDTRSLSISNSTIRSFDYFADNLSYLEFIWIHPCVDIYEDAGAIPYINNLRSIKIRHRNALQLIANNNHIDGHLGICLGYLHYQDMGTVYVHLSPLQKFNNITEFSYMGYATTLDVYYLKSAQNLFFIDIWSDVYYVNNIESLSELENLFMLLLPRQTVIHLMENDELFRDDIFIGIGS